MILFIYGEDTYRSHQKLMQIKAKFVDVSLGDTNMSILDIADQETDFTQITRMVLALPFLAKSRLVITKNLLLAGKKKLQEQVLEFLPKVPETTVLVFYESGVPDRRTALFKALGRPTTSTYEESKTPPRRWKIQTQEFKLLEPYELKKWIKNEVEANNARIDNAAMDELIEYVGNDLWRMSNEIQKLTANSSKLTAQEVELLVRPRITANIFDLIDAIGNKNIEKAQSELHKLLKAGENELYIHTMIVYQFRNLLVIKDLMTNSKLQTLNSKQTPNSKSQITNNEQIPISKFEITKLSGLHPYVAEKTMAQAKNYTMDRLKEIYQILLDYDIQMKTGKIEPKLALDLLVVELIK